MAVKKKKKENSIGPIVKPGCGDDKNGCLWCPLLPYSLDFENHRENYNRDPEKILQKADHRVHHRRVRDPMRTVRVLFVGEAPGQQEDEQGQPFIGRAGDYLRTEVRRVVGVKSKDVAYTNCVKCQTPSNRNPNKTEVKSCAPDLIREINKRKPEVIVALGNFSLHLLTGQSGISTLQGNTLSCTRDDIPDVPIVACFHPAYILRSPHEHPKFERALRLSRKHLEGKAKKKQGQGKYETITSVERVEKLLKSFRKNKNVVAFDTETGGLSPFQETYPPMLCFSFSDEEGKGYTIPLDHVESPWALPKYIERQMRLRIEGLREQIQDHNQRAATVKTSSSKTRHERLANDKRREIWRLRNKVIGGVKKQYENGGREERECVKKALRSFFSDTTVPKIAQNQQFDAQHIYECLGVMPENVVRDTMLTHLTIDDQRGTHGLKTLAVYYTGMGGYEKPLEDYTSQHAEADPKNGGSYANIPGKMLFSYAAMDTDTTLRVDRALRNDNRYKKTPQFKNLAECFFPRLSRTVADMEYRGAHLDFKKLDEIREQYVRQMEEDKRKIHDVPEVKAFLAQKVKSEELDRTPEFNPMATEDVAEVLYGYFQLTPISLTDKGLETIKLRMQKLEDDDQRADFDTVWQQAVEDQEWNLFSVSRDILHQHSTEGNEFSELVLDYKKHQKVVSTFLDPFKQKADKSHCIHGSYLIHGTSSGRLSSASPNLQNLPPDVRPIYTSRHKNGVILEVDNSQIELRVASCWFDEPKLIEAYQKGLDVHRQTAIIVSGKKTEKKYARMDEKEQKRWRDIGKRCNFLVLYGGTASRLQSTLHEYGVDRSLDECENILQTFFDNYSGLKKGMERTLKSVRRHGYLMTETGRCRRFPEINSDNDAQRSSAERMAINFPIQSLASEMTLLAMTLVNERLKREGWKSIVTMTVHDSVILDCPLSEVLEVAKIVQYTMENVMTLSTDLLPGCDWSWMTVPVESEVKIGWDWGSGVEFKSVDGMTRKKLKKAIAKDVA